MGRSPCCDKLGLKKGPWTPEEDQKLLAYIQQHGHGSWRALPTKAGLQRCGKSCRLRWTNYLRPDIKRGKFSLQEEQTIIQLHALLGNRWSAIATHLPKRTDNEIKNYWNTHLKKRLAKMGIDPLTHKPKNDALLSSRDAGPSKNSANLSHMAQWESARLEAEARLVRQSKLRGSNVLNHQPEFSKTVPPLASPPLSLDILKAWNNAAWPKPSVEVNAVRGDLESPTSTLSYSENVPLQISNARIGESSGTFIKFVGNSEDGMKEDGEEDWNCPQTHLPGSDFVEKFTDLLLNKSGGDDDQSFSEGGEESDTGDGSAPSGTGSEYYEDDKNYWNSILNLVNSSPSHSPMF
ncbi:hypothetical protein LguiA_017239 [Lonicera macranthoides]